MIKHGGRKSSKRAFVSAGSFWRSPTNKNRLAFNLLSSIANHVEVTPLFFKNRESMRWQPSGFESAYPSIPVRNDRWLIENGWYLTMMGNHCVWLQLLMHTLSGACLNCEDTAASWCRADRTDPVLGKTVPRVYYRTTLFDWTRQPGKETVHTYPDWQGFQPYLIIIPDT
jgi:hypothetical protein